MRLDKFLKLSRLVRRRTVAKELCEAGAVSVNGKPAKPAQEVAVGDVIEIRLPGGRRRRAAVEWIPERVPPKNAVLYRELPSEEGPGEV
jgi:ribosomal 50S subunit-recycling heat shock protein